MKRTAFSLFFLLVAGCSEPFTPAIGPSNEVTLVTSLSDSSSVVELIKVALEREIVTVQREKLYSVEVVAPEGLGKRRNYRNLILLADLTTQDKVARTAQSIVSESAAAKLEKGESGYFLALNVWGKGQTILVVAGKGEEALEQLVRRELETMCAMFDESVTERTKEILFSPGRDERMMRYLRSTYGWQIGIPKDASTAEDGPGRLVKIVMRDPVDRFLFVYWEGISEQFSLDERSCLEKRGALAEKYYDGDQIDYSRTNTLRTQFRGAAAIRIEGVWQNDKYVAGGPFRTYCFLWKGRLYIIDAVVFAPGKDKGPYLRQLEALARTFEDFR